MAIELGKIRLGLYITLLVFSFILFALSCARIAYTEHLPRGDPLNSGRDFYDPVIVELIFTTLVTMGWCVFMLVAWFKALEVNFLRLFRDEVAVLGIIWLFWIGGATSASTLWGSLTFCQQFEACRVLSALVAFSWLGFVTLIAILAVSARMSWEERGLMTPLPVRGGREMGDMSENSAGGGPITVAV